MATAPFLVIRTRAAWRYWSWPWNEGNFPSGWPNQIGCPSSMVWAYGESTRPKPVTGPSYPAWYSMHPNLLEGIATNPNISKTTISTTYPDPPHGYAFVETAPHVYAGRQWVAPGAGMLLEYGPTYQGFRYGEGGDYDAIYTKEIVRVDIPAFAGNIIPVTTAAILFLGGLMLSGGAGRLPRPPSRASPG